MSELDVASGDVDVLFAEGEIDLEEARNLPCHTGVRLLVAPRTRLVGPTPTRRCKWFAVTARYWAAGAFC